MMKTLRYFTAAMVLSGLAACQSDDTDWGGFDADPNAVRISATVGETPTRSNPTGDATTVKRFNAGDKISVSSNQTTAVYEFDGTDWSPTNPDKYLTWDSNRQQFTAYYPDTYRGSGNVPQEQNTEELIATADYMKFDGELAKQETVSFTMSRQTARIVISNDFSWNDEYMEGVTATHKVDGIRVNCVGVCDIVPYQQGNYYALVNPGSAAPDATFLTLTVSPIDGQSAPVTHTVKGIPEFEAGYSNEYHITIGKSGVTLGWCDAESAAGHEVIIQFSQIETGTTQEITIKQESLATGGNCTYYQWGRKDPMLPSNGLGNVDKPHNGNYTFTKAQGKVTLGKAIQNPHEVYDSGPSGWYEWYSAQSTVAGKDFFQNLWDANDCSTGDRYNIGIKTVYDPSPVGYIVPPSDAISGFTFDGKSAGKEDKDSYWDKSYTDKFNSVEKTRGEVDAIKGMTFYCKGMNGVLNTYNKDGGVIYFPAAGTRDEYYGNELDRVGIRGNFWTTAQTGSG